MGRGGAGGWLPWLDGRWLECLLPPKLIIQRAARTICLAGTEIRAIKQSVFGRSVEIRICFFHIMQAWQRYLKRSEHGLSSVRFLPGAVIGSMHVPTVHGRLPAAAPPAGAPHSCAPLLKHFQNVAFLPSSPRCCRSSKPQSSGWCGLSSCPATSKSMRNTWHY